MLNKTCEYNKIIIANCTSEPQAIMPCNVNHLQGIISNKRVISLMTILSKLVKDEDYIYLIFGPIVLLGTTSRRLGLPTNKLIDCSNLDLYCVFSYEVLSLYLSQFRSGNVFKAEERLTAKFKLNQGALEIILENEKIILTEDSVRFEV